MSATDHEARLREIRERAEAARRLDAARVAACAHDERCGLAMPGKPSHSTCVACRFQADDAVWDALAATQAKLAAAERENTCDVCCGDGRPISGKECMCSGTGKMSEAARYLRVQLVAAERRVGEVERDIASWLRTPESVTFSESPDGIVEDEHAALATNIERGRWREQSHE